MTCEHNRRRHEGKVTVPERDRTDCVHFKINLCKLQKTMSFSNRLIEEEEEENQSK